MYVKFNSFDFPKYTLNRKHLQDKELKKKRMERPTDLEGNSIAKKNS